MRAEDWVKFHRDFTRGKWVNVPRGQRFVLMELSLLCKPGDGLCELPPPRGRHRDPISRCVDMLGGNRREARDALAFLTADGDLLADDLDDMPTVHFETPDGDRVDAAGTAHEHDTDTTWTEHGRVLVVIASWARRNSVGASAKRMRRKRAKDKGSRDLTKKGDGSQSVTRDTGRDATEESRGEKIPPTDPPSGKKGKANGKTRGTRLPDDWKPSSKLLRWAVEQGHETDWIRDQTERFGDYWRDVPGARGRKVSWDGTWRNWIKRSADDKRPGGRQGRLPGQGDDGSDRPELRPLNPKGGK